MFQINQVKKQFAPDSECINRIIIIIFVKPGKSISLLDRRNNLSRPMRKAVPANIADSSGLLKGHFLVHIWFALINLKSIYSIY